MPTPSAVENKQDSQVSPEKSRKISRRQALISIFTIAASTLILPGIGALFRKYFSNTKPVAQSTSRVITLPTQTPKPSIGEAFTYTSATSPSKEISKEVGGITFTFDSEGIPKYYVDLQGHVQSFDKKQMLALQSRAKTEGVMEVVRAFRGKETDTANLNTKSFEYSQVKPETTELPKDTLTESELKERGITIVQSTNGTELMLRSGAFEKGELLEGYEKGASKNLTIVLVPGPIIWTGYMKDPRYQPYIRYIGSSDLPLEKLKNKNFSLIEFDINTATDKIKLIREQLTQKNENTDRLNKELINAQQELRIYKENYRLHFDAFSEDDWVLEFYNKASSGLQIGGTDPIIFASVGGETTGKTVEYLELVVDETGEFKVLTRIEVQPSIDFEPRISQTYPDKNSYKYNLSVSPDDTQSYPYGAFSAQQLLSHELTHNWENNEYWRMFREKAGKTTKEDVNQYLLHNEYRTDTRSRDVSVRRSENWINSGYTDNSKQYIVFRNKRGEIILTGAESPELPV